MKNRHGIPVLAPVKVHRRSCKQPQYLRFTTLKALSLYRRQNGKCFYCFFPLGLEPWSPMNPTGWTRDHFFPKSHGNRLNANMVLACRACNCGKSDDAPTQREVRRFTRLYLGEKLTEIFGKGATK